MQVSDWIAWFSAVFAGGSLLAAVAIYRAQFRMIRAAETTRLHDLWGSERYLETRAKVFALVEEWEANGGQPTPVILSYRNQDPAFSSERVEIGRIAFFFADLNAMLDEGLVNEKLAFRLFARAQFDWFGPFLLAVAEEVELRERSRAASSTTKIVRWVQEVRALHKRFSGMNRSWRSHLSVGDHTVATSDAGARS